MKYTLRNFLKDPMKYSNEFYNFYDWFCNKKTLKRRMMTLIPKLKFLVKENILNPDKVYVNFKNTKSINGLNYDEIRVFALDDGTYLGGFCPVNGIYLNDKFKCNVWINENKEIKNKKFRTWTDFKKEIKNNSEYKNYLKKHFEI